MNVQNPMTIDFGSIVTQITSDCTIGVPDIEHPSESCHENNYTAIWDTGARMSSISKRVVDDLGLEPIGAIPVEGVHGEKSANVYMINITPPVGVKFFAIFVTEALMTSVDVLIGMDIIKYGDFLIANGDNKTVMRFQVPPMNSNL